MTIKWIVGILNKDGRVLIAKIRGKELLIPRMQWTFPYIMLKDEESPRVAIKKLFEGEFKINVDVGKFMFKESPSENPKIEMYFYELKHKLGNVINSKNFSEFSWIMPTQIIKYFTNSVSRELLDYLTFLEKKGEGLIMS
jgi:hypothetical protein